MRPHIWCTAKRVWDWVEERFALTVRAVERAEV